MFNDIGLEENFIYDVINGKNVFCDEIYDKVDYTNVFNITIQQRIFPSVYCLLYGKIDFQSFTLFEKEKNRLMLKNAIINHQIKAIVKCFSDHNIKFVISKGIAISNEIYKIPFLRDMNDVDIVISSDDYIMGSKLLESIGYVLAESTNNKEEYLEARRSQCTFIKNGCLPIELKDRIQYVNSNHLKKWFERIEYKKIGGVSVPVFSVEDMFINVLVNSNKNMSTPYGIDNDYKIRDILEFYLFIIKNTCIFTKKFVDMLTHNGYAHSLSCMMDYCEEFFTDYNLKSIPLLLRNARITDYGPDHVKWGNDIVARFFNIEQRILEHHSFRLNNV